MKNGGLKKTLATVLDLQNFWICRIVDDLRVTPNRLRVLRVTLRGVRVTFSLRVGPNKARPARAKEREVPAAEEAIAALNGYPIRPGVVLKCQSAERQRSSFYHVRLVSSREHVVFGVFHSGSVR